MTNTVSTAVSRTSGRSATRSLVLSALFLALGMVLPYLTGGIPQIGNMLLPMHIPVLLCGFVVGGPWGAAVGFVCPLLRSVLLSAPPMFLAVPMAFELAAYGLVSGVLYRRLPRTLGGLYASLIAAMVAGRLVWGAVKFVLMLSGQTQFSFALFLSGAVTAAIPGIVLQLVLIPLLITALRRAGQME